MNKALILMTIFLGTTLAFAGAQAPAKAKAVEVGNKLCPISGEKVGQMGDAVKYEYNGQIYNLCCGMCEKDFQKDPQKYSKIADEEVAGAKESGHSDHNHGT
jgi:YHS domain-containing protein